MRLADEPWFPKQEFDDRLARIQSELRARQFDALLAFLPESVTYLTGFFTRGYGSLQFAVIPAEGEPTVACRNVEEYYLKRTCAYPSYAMWSDADDKTGFAADVLRQLVPRSGRIGVEMSAWQLNARRYLDLLARSEGLEFVDASDIVQTLRFIKSPREVEYQRLAARAAEAGMAAAVVAAQEGVTEREVAAAITSAMIRAGSDLPGPGVLSSGDRAFHLHGAYSDRVLERGDTLQVETTPCVRHYHARFMRTVKINQASSADREVARQIIELQDAALSEVAPGVAASVPDRIYRQGLAKLGFEQPFTNKTFYSIGLMLSPNGGEPLEAVPSATWTFKPGMTFHSYVLAGSFGFSETVHITDHGYERLTNYPRELLVS